MTVLPVDVIVVSCRCRPREKYFNHSSPELATKVAVWATIRADFIVDWLFRGLQPVEEPHLLRIIIVNYAETEVGDRLQKASGRIALTIRTSLTSLTTGLILKPSLAVSAFTASLE